MKIRIACRLGLSIGLAALAAQGCSSSNTNSPPYQPPPPGSDAGYGVQPDVGFTEAGLPKPQPDSGQFTPPPGSSPCAGGGSQRAVIVAAANLNDVTQGNAALLRINSGGLLSDSQVRFGPIPIPRAVAMRPDGQEAAIAFGTSSSDGSKKHGVFFVSLAPDGSQATKAQELTLTGNAAAMRLAYTSNSSLLVGRLGPEVAQLVPVSRPNPGAPYAMGTPYDMPDSAVPQDLEAIPNSDNQALVIGAPMGSIESALRHVSDAAGSVTELGAPLPLSDNPYFSVMHPRVKILYIPVPARGASYHDPNPPGELRMVSGTGSGWILGSSPFSVTSYTSNIAISPDGSLMVFADLNGSTGQAELYAVELDSNGKPVAEIPSFAPFGASFIHGLAVTAEGHIVVSVKDNTYDVISFARVGQKSWIQCPAKVTFPGGAELQIANP